jgi:hypothetical protein
LPALEHHAYREDDVSGGWNKNKEKNKKFS